MHLKWTNKCPLGYSHLLPHTIFPSFDACKYFMCIPNRLLLKLNFHDLAKTPEMKQVSNKDKHGDTGLQIRVPNQRFVFSFLNQNFCCGYSKEPSQWDRSFEHTKQMFKLIDKKIFTILRWKVLPIWTNGDIQINPNISETLMHSIR